MGFTRSDIMQETGVMVHYSGEDTRYIRSERLEKIGEEFNLNNYSSVSNAISRVKRRLRSNKFKKSYGQILDSL